MNRPIDPDKDYTSPECNRRDGEERRELWSRRTHQTARVNHKFRRVRIDSSMYYVPKNERIDIRRHIRDRRGCDHPKVNNGTCEDCGFDYDEYV